MTQVFVTGMGLVSPLGISVDEFWQAAMRGESGIRGLTRFDTSDLPTTIGGEVDGLDQPRFEMRDNASWRRMDRSSRFAVDAAHQAIRHAGLSQVELSESAIIVGAGLSGLDTLQQQTDVLLNRGPGRVSPATIPTLMPNASAANISLAFDVRGPAWTVSGACASAGIAIIEAAEAIRAGRFERVIVGGTESSLTRLGIASFCRMGAMTKSSNDRPHRAMRPFDVTRDGTVMSEGAGMLILESESSVRRRNVDPIAEVIGWASNSDAHHLVAPEPSGRGLSDAVRLAIRSAGLEPRSIASRTYVNAHGTATPMNDELETLALTKVFGRAAEALQVSSTKSMTGHMIGASGAVESIACILALREGRLPPTINLEHAAPECTLDYIPQQARKADVSLALNTTMGFGGHNVALLLRTS